MNRRSFFKVVGGLTAAIALPLEPLAAILPKTWGISPVRWTKVYDYARDEWLFRADVFVGLSVAETPERITLENPHHLCVDMTSRTEELNADAKEAALLVLMNSARDELARATA